jgi:hypothetical protein
MDEELRRLLQAILGGNLPESITGDKRKLFNLSEDEAKEFRTLDYEGETLNKRYNSIMQDKEYLSLRAKMFWAKIRRAHKLLDDGNKRFMLSLVEAGEAVEMWETIPQEDDHA